MALVDLTTLEGLIQRRARLIITQLMVLASNSRQPESATLPSYRHICIADGKSMKTYTNPAWGLLPAWLSYMIKMTENALRF